MDIIKDNELCIYDNDIEYYMNEFIDLYHIENMQNEPQAVYNSALMYIRKKLFSDKSILINKATVNGGAFNYNYELLDTICNYYIYMSGLYNKDTSISGFSKLTGINQDTMYLWNRLENENPPAFSIYKKLVNNRLDFLTGKLTDGKQNPVGTIAVLNHYYGWQKEYNNNVIDTPETTKALTAKYTEIV